MGFLKVLTVLLAGPVFASAANNCTRELLQTTRDKFFKAASGGAQPILASNVKIALNNKPATSLASTPYAQFAKATWTAFLVQALDTEICNIATFRVASSQLLSTRLKVDSAGAISEVEFLQAVKGDQFFRPSGFPTTVPPIFNQKQTPHAPPKIPASWTPAMGMFEHRADVNKATCKAMSGEARV
jgi:hypothetical protein